MDAIDQDMISRECRDQYLAAMGIQVWTPRGEVAESAPSPGEASAAKAIMAGLSNRPPEEPVGEIPELTDQAPPPHEVAPEVTATPELEPVIVAEDIVVPTFCLSAVFLPEQVLVVSDVPLESGVQPLAHQALLGEILVAMDLVAPAVSQAACFKWPLFEQVKVDQREVVAREAVGAYVAGQLCGQQPKFVLLLGEVAVSYLHSPEQGSAFAVEQMKSPVIECPALEAMLERPGLKARAWKNICEYLGEREQPGSV